MPPEDERSSKRGERKGKRYKETGEFMAYGGWEDEEVNWWEERSGVCVSVCVCELVVG